MYSVYKEGPSSRQIFRYKFKVSMFTSIYDTGGCGMSNLPWLVGSRASLGATWKRCFTINLGRKRTKSDLRDQGLEIAGIH